MSALMAGTAYANPLGFRMNNTDGSSDNAQETIVNLALEANDMSASAYFEFEIFDIDGAEFPTSNDLDIVITLPTGVDFASPGANSSDVVNGIAGSVSGASLTSGGVPGDRDVRYNVSLDDNDSDSNFTIGFHIPLTLDLSVCDTADKDDLGSYSLQVDVTTLVNGGDPLSGTPIFGQTVSGADAIILQCVDGIVADVDSDEATNDSRVALSDYNTFLPSFGIFDPDDAAQLPLQGTTNFDQGQTSLTPLGTINYSMDTTAVIKMGPTTGTNNLLDSADVETLGFTIQYEDITGMSFTGYNFSGFGTIGLPNDPGVIDSFITFTSASMGVAEGNDDLCGNGPLDTLERQGRRFGFFDWIGEDKAVKNVFRVSGLPADPITGAAPEDVEVDLLFRNSRGGPQFDGRKRLVIPASDISNGVATIRSTDFDAINPGYDQGDVLILIQNTSRDIDVDRLQVDRTGSLNDFGDGSNFGLSFILLLKHVMRPRNI